MSLGLLLLGARRGDAPFTRERSCQSLNARLPLQLPRNPRKRDASGPRSHDFPDWCTRFS